MKNFITIAFLICSSFAEAITFPDGEVKQLDSLDGTIDVIFKVYNDEKDPLILNEAKTSNHCEAHFTKDLIMKGKTGIVRLRCQFLERGPFERSLWLGSNQKYTILKVKGISEGMYAQQKRNVDSCQRPYQEQLATGEEDFVDNTNKFVGYAFQKISPPDEGFTSYDSYLKYKKKWPEKYLESYEKLFRGLIDCEEARKNSLRAVWLGDSMSKNFAVSQSNIVNLMVVRMFNQSNGIFDRNNEQILSFTERISKHVPIFMINLSRVGANVSTELDFIDERILKKKSFSEQVDNVLKLEFLPHYVGVWLGHNDLDWKLDMPQGETYENFISYKSKLTGREYVKSLKKLIEGLRPVKHKVAINLYAMGNIADYALKTRPQVEAARMKDSTAYPTAEDEVYDLFPSMKPEYRHGFVEFYRLTDYEIRTRVNELLRTYDIPSHIKISYLNDLKELDIANIKNINRQDGWHFSDAGKNEMGRRIYESSKGAFKHLGITY